MIFKNIDYDLCANLKLLPSFLPPSPGNITAVFTTKAKGHELIDILERLGYNVTIEIIEGSRHIRSLANINRYGPNGSSLFHN